MVVGIPCYRRTRLFTNVLRWGWHIENNMKAANARDGLIVKRREVMDAWDKLFHRLATDNA